MRSLFTALSMFTKVPVKGDWQEDKGSEALMFFPICGLVCSLSYELVLWILINTVSSIKMAAYIFVLCYFIMPGFLHLDGFMDVCDAILSSRDQEGKLKILKDSNVGSFSVICIVLLLLGFICAVETVFTNANFHIFKYILLIPVISRSYGSIYLYTFKPLASSSIMKYFLSGYKSIHLIVVSLCAVISSMLICYFNIYLGACVLLSVVIVYLLVLLIRKLLGGINGDVIGFCVTLTEILSYIIYAMTL